MHATSPPITNLTKWWRVVLLSILIALGPLYAVQWKISASEPSYVEDFVIFFTAGTLARSDGFDSVYEIEQQRATQQQILGTELTTADILIYNHLPCLIPIFYLLTLLNYAQARLLWSLFLVLLYSSAIAYLMKNTANLSWHLKKLAIAAIFLFYPIFVSVYQGQDTAFLFLGLTLWYVGLEKKHNPLLIAGIVLSTFRPHISLGIIIAYSITHPKVFWSILLAGCLWAVFNGIIVGPQGAADFIRLLLMSAQGLHVRMSDASMLNLLGLLHRIFDTAPTPLLRPISWVGYGIGVLLCIVVWGQKKRAESWKLGLSILIALFFAPHLHYHDLAVVTIPIVLILEQVHSITTQYLLVGIFPVFSLLTLLTPTWYHAWPYLTYLLLAITIVMQPHVGDGSE